LHYCLNLYFQNRQFLYYPSKVHYYLNLITSFILKFSYIISFNNSIYLIVTRPILINHFKAITIIIVIIKITFKTINIIITTIVTTIIIIKATIIAIIKIKITIITIIVTNYFLFVQINHYLLILNFQCF